jgi:1-acyl-sn-glycerol-3-phosphate acyltransferase
LKRVFEKISPFDKISRNFAMASFEEEFRRLEPILNRWIDLLLLGKKIEVRQEENFVREGPNILVGNHCGAFKDVAVILKIVPRHVFFTANKEIFSKKKFDLLILKHLQRHLKDFGSAVNTILKPVKYYFVRFISNNIGKVGTIPVDFQSTTGEARKLGQEYLREGRVIVALQGRGRVQTKDPHPYVSQFKPGTSIMAYNLYCDNNISVPVTPLAMYGTQTPWLVPAKVLVNVGKPMYITDYLKNGYTGSVENFRGALERQVRALFRDLIRP